MIISETYIIGFFLLIAVVVIIVFVSRHKKRIPSKQGYGPMDFGVGYMALYNVPKDATTATPGSIAPAEDLLRWWLGYVSRMTPETAGTAYALCNNLQTVESIEYYGLIQEGYETMKRLRTALSGVDPASIRTNADVQKAFGPVCIKMANEGAGSVSLSGLYKDVGSLEGMAGAYIF
jgi:hypothetical protein